MGLSFSTEGRVAYRVTISPNSVPLGRFGNAVFRTEARVSHVDRFSTKKWRAVVWLKTTKVSQFESLCIPLGFEFLTTREMIRYNETESESKE
jgi:hypothetical protein